jgi:predicted transcriptional regulator
MGIVKARVTGHRKLHIHNTLENFADFTKGVIEDKIKNNQRDGIGFDYMTLGIMLAFDFEAKVNQALDKAVSRRISV